MNVLSLFDGMSCGQLALQKANIKYDNYFASEIKTLAIKITQHHFPNTIQLGDVKNINLTITKMRGGFLEMSDDEDDYINKTLKNPNWWTSNLNLNDKKYIEDLKKIKKGINPSIKFDLNPFSADEKQILKDNKII